MQVLMTASKQSQDDVQRRYPKNVEFYNGKNLEN